MKAWVRAAGKLARYEHIGWKVWPHSRCWSFHSGASAIGGQLERQLEGELARGVMRAGRADIGGPGPPCPTRRSRSGRWVAECSTLIRAPGLSDQVPREIRARARSAPRRRTCRGSPSEPPVRRSSRSRTSRTGRPGRPRHCLRRLGVPSGPVRTRPRSPHRCRTRDGSAARQRRCRGGPNDGSRRSRVRRRRRPSPARRPESRRRDGIQRRRPLRSQRSSRPVERRP